MVRTARQPAFRIDVPSSSLSPSPPSPPSSSAPPPAVAAVAAVTAAPSPVSPAQRSSHLQTQMQTHLTELEQQLPTLGHGHTTGTSTGANGSTNNAPEQTTAGQTPAVERLARCVRSLAGVMLALLREVDQEEAGDSAETKGATTRGREQKAWGLWRERCRRALVEGQGMTVAAKDGEAEVESGA